MTLDESLVLLPLFEMGFEAEEGLLRIRRTQQNAERGYNVVQRFHLSVLEFRCLIKRWNLTGRSSFLYPLLYFVVDLDLTPDY